MSSSDRLAHPDGAGALVEGDGLSKPFLQVRPRLPAHLTDDARDIGDQAHGVSCPLAAVDDAQGPGDESPSPYGCHLKLVAPPANAKVRHFHRPSVEVIDPQT